MAKIWQNKRLAHFTELHSSRLVNVTPWLNWIWFGLKVLSKLLILRGNDKSNRDVFLSGLVAASVSLSPSFSYTCLSHVLCFFFSHCCAFCLSFYLRLPVNIVFLCLLPCSSCIYSHSVLASVSSVCFFHYAWLLAAYFSCDLCIVSRILIFEPCLFFLLLAHPPSLPCLTLTTHFLGLSTGNSSINQCSFPISPLHPLLWILLCALSFLLVANCLWKEHV